MKTAPRTPVTTKVFDCLNDANNDEKLANDIAFSSLQQASSAYDKALAVTAAAESTTAEKKSQLDKQTVDVAFLKAQLEAARKRKPELELRFKNENAKAIACNSGNACTIAEKEIKVLASNNASEHMINNNADIDKYIKDIADAEKTLGELTTAFKGIEAGAKAGIEAAEAKELIAQTAYNEAKIKHKATLAAFNKLHDDCKINAFHANQVKLEGLRKDLEAFGITIKVPKAVSEENPGLDKSKTITVPDDDIPKSKYDCRYRQIKQCQGTNLLKLNDLQRDTCRQMVTSECWAATYDNYWILDFLSFFLMPIALFACIFESRFSYSICFSGYAYTWVLYTLQYSLGVFY